MSWFDKLTMTFFKIIIQLKNESVVVRQAHHDSRRESNRAQRAAHLNLKQLLIRFAVSWFDKLTMTGLQKVIGRFAPLTSI